MLSFWHGRGRAALYALVFVVCAFCIGDVVAGRYELTEYLGSAAFSKAVQAVDLDTGDVVCLKIVKNNKDYFDQSLDEIKLLR